MTDADLSPFTSGDDVIKVIVSLFDCVSYDISKFLRAYGAF